MCTANICRSPMAEAFLRARMPTVDPVVTVASAGLLDGGRRVPDEVLSVTSPYGLDLSGHRSRELSTVDLPGVDLVLGMERRHVREVVLMDPTSFPRTFTLKELVRRGDRLGPRGVGKPVEEWLSAAHRGRERADMVGSSPTDEVADPYGSPVAAFRDTAAELHDLVGRLVGLLWPTT